MTKKSISSIGDKLAKVSESFSVNMYDNGYLFEISGRDEEGDYKSAKIMVSDLSQLAALVQEATEMPRDD
jgi:exo-beta-1,3-glucanase (GH17 family)